VLGFLSVLFRLQLACFHSEAEVGVSHLGDQCGTIVKKYPIIEECKPQLTRSA
jgi:hypothetical protein